MAFMIKHFRYVIYLSVAVLLTSCVIKPNDSYNRSGYDNNWNNYKANNRSISERAQNACFKRMGPGARIQRISDLRPGWFEVIMFNPRSGRKAACTVNQQGYIGDWVNMKGRY